MRAPAFWQRRGLIAFLLWPFSMLYVALVRWRLAGITPQTVGVPVICVGNFSAGGAGKTPTVIALCELLKARNPQVISRGYKGKAQGVLCIDPARHQSAEVGDEPLMIAAHAPCFVAKRRLAAARAAKAAGAGVILMDDGLQNPSLVQDIRLLVVNGQRGFGNGWPMPAGPGREPLHESLCKADAVICIGERKHPSLRALPAHLPVFAATLQPHHPAEWAGRRVIAFAGIAYPDGFFATLTRIGAELIAAHAFPDHHPFRPQEITRLQQQAQQEGAVLVTTQKDWVRLSADQREMITPLPVYLVWENPAALRSFIHSQLAGNS